MSGLVGKQVQVLLNGKPTGYQGVQVASDHACWLVRLEGDRHISHFQHKHGFRTVAVSPVAVSPDRYVAAPALGSPQDSGPTPVDQTPPSGNQ